MAVLNKIRQRSVFLIIIIALALFAFVLADVIRNGGLSTQKSQNVVATVNGEDIEREEFARQVEGMQRNLGPNATTLQAVNRVWDIRLREEVLESQFRELGINVGEAQVKQLLRMELSGNPNFTNEAGMFDENRLQEYVANLKATSPQAYQQWVAYENSIADNARENIYFNLVRAGIGATLLEGEKAYRLENDNVDLKFVQIPYSSIADSEVSVSKDEIRKYVKNHPERFKTEKARDLQFVYFEEEPSQEDEKEAREAVEAVLGQRVVYNNVSGANDTLPGFKNVENVEAFVNRNSDNPYQDRYQFRDQLRGDHAEAIFNLEEGEIYGPYKENEFWKVTRMVETRTMADSAKASHILISWQGLQTAGPEQRTKEQAKSLADSIAGVVRSNKGKFEELATEYSADLSNKEQGGDLGYFRPGDMIKDFSDFVFNNRTGEVGVVETQFGYHVIHIEEKTAEERAVKTATIARRVVPSEKTLNDLYTEVTKFEIAAKEEGFKEVAKEQNEDIRTVKDLKVMDENIPGVGPQRRIVQWAFEDGVKQGDVKRFDLPEGYIVAQVTGVKDAGLMSAEEASAVVTPILLQEKKAELIKQKITAATVAEIAAKHNQSVQTASAVNRKNPTLAGAGNEPKVVGAAFALNQGEVSKPVTGNKGVYVVEVVAVNRAADLESYRNWANRITAERRQAAAPGVTEALKEAAEIEDNRARFY